MERHLTTALIVTAAMLASGCGSKNTKPTCPVPDGVKCMSTVDVYERTHGSEYVTSGTVTSDGYGTSGSFGADTRGAMRVALDDDALALVEDRGVAQADLSAGTNEEPPVRTPAKVLRVWIGAWQDKDGGLHMPSHVFKEIEPRRWRIGSDAETTTGTFRLLDGLGVQAEHDAHPQANANASGGRPSSSK